jgi:hypothetical protein
LTRAGRWLATAALLVALVAGCDSSHGPDTFTVPSATHSGRPIPRNLDDVGVIRTWADTLRAGDPDSAARFFAVPVRIANGTPPLTLHSSLAVRAFNESLPCGARLLRTRRKGRYIVATFRLTNRPGGDCGSGVGDTAATAFRLRHGKIVEWLRVPTPPELGPPPGSGTA